MLDVLYVWRGKRSISIYLPQNASSVMSSFGVTKSILWLSAVEVCYLALNGEKVVTFSFCSLIFLRSRESGLPLLRGRRCLSEALW